MKTHQDFTIDAEVMASFRKLAKAEGWAMSKKVEQYFVFELKRHK